jgi:alanine racemase
MRPCSAKIHLDRLQANFREVKALAGANVELFPVVKADAYGHGAIQCAKALLAEGARTFCVACVEEALEIIESGVLARFILLSGVFPGEEKEILQYGLIPVLSDLENAQTLSAAAKRQNKKVKVHLKVDTGMGRLGVLPEDFSELYNGVRGMEGLEIEGVLSHLACSDSLKEKDVQFTDKQVQDFQVIKKALSQQDAGIRYFHLAQSAGLMKYPESYFNSSRPGLILYGASPFHPAETGAGAPKVDPVMSLVSKVSLLKTMPQGSSISYGATTIVKRKSRVGVVSIGYADGLPRSVPAGFHFMVKGRPAPLLGVVTMDWIMVDLTEVPEAKTGDEVIIFGKEDEGEVSVSALAHAGRTISYEIFTRLGKRVKREFVNTQS